MLLLGFGSSMSSVDSWKAFLASASDRSEKLDDRRLEMFPVTLLDLRFRRLDSSMVKDLRSRAPPFVVGECSSSWTAMMDHSMLLQWRCLALYKDVNTGKPFRGNDCVYNFLCWCY